MHLFFNDQISLYKTYLKNLFNYIVLESDYEILDDDWMFSVKTED